MFASLAQRGAKSWAACLIALVLGETLLGCVIMKKRPYTEIDWATYMEQVDMVANGERDYAKIRGAQGPLVYPAGFVWLYGLLRRFTHGSVSAAQPYFVALLAVDAAATGAVYAKAFAEVPSRFQPVLLSLLASSRRAHSVFVLRLFNDAPCATMTHVAILALISGYPMCACVLYSTAVSIKMSALLYAPAWYVVLASRGGHRYAVTGVAICAIVQVALAWPFVLFDPVAYITRAFDLGRGFKHKWSVNFRWMPCTPRLIETDIEDCDGAFSSTWFKAGALAFHAAALIVFAQARWCRPHGGFLAFFRRPTTKSFSPLTQAAMLFECNFIGLAFARSLHFQFCVWYANSLPFLAACTDIPLLLKFALLLAIEAAWNPWGHQESSSPVSSLLLTAAHLGLLVALFSAKPLDLLKQHDSRHQDDATAITSKKKS